MKQEDLTLSEVELKKFNDFVQEHLACSTNETLSNVYNIKLVFNIKNGKEVMPTCLCSACGDEDLIAGANRFEVPEYEKRD